MTEPDSDSYKHAFRDIVYGFVEEAKELTNSDDIAERTALLRMLGRIKNEAVAFGLDLEYLGLADFDPVQWYLSRKNSI